MHCKQMRAKKGNEPPKGRTCPSRCSECPSPMDPIPLAVPAAPPRVHRMPSLQPTLPSDREQRLKCHQSAAQRFYPTCLMRCKQMRAKKGNEAPKCRTSPSRCSECPSPMDPIPLAVAAAPLGVHRMPSLQPTLPSGRAQRFKCPESGAEVFTLPATCPMNPQRVELVPHGALSARLRWTRFLLQCLRRPLGYT